MMSVYRCSTFSVSKKWNIQLFNLKSDIGCENQSRSLILYLFEKIPRQSDVKGGVGCRKIPTF